MLTSDFNSPLSSSLWISGKSVQYNIYIWNFNSKNNFKILTCWLRYHLGFSREFPNFTWILGVSPGVSHPSISYVLSPDLDWQDETSGSHYINSRIVGRREGA